MNDYLSQLRKKAGLSQNQIAERLKISRPTYIAVEKNQRELKTSEAKKLAEMFDLSLTDFLAQKEPANSKQNKINPKNLEKFKEVLLYILQKVGARSNVGQTVLYKLLYFIDFDYYEKYEEKFLGLQYQRNYHGPTPIVFAKAVETMKQVGDLEEVKSKFFSYDQKKYLPHRSPDLSKLSAQELEMIDEVLQKYGDKTANWLSDYSHKDIPWASHDPGEIINYDTVFYRDQNYSVRIEDDDEL